MNLTVIITNYNSWSLVLNAVAQCRLHEDPSKLSFVIVDDCSPTPIPADWPSDLPVYVNSSNLGFAASLNKGITLAESDIVLIMDADAYPIDRFLPVISDAFQKHSDIGLLGFTTVDSQGNLTSSYDEVPNWKVFVFGQKLEALLKRIVRTAPKELFAAACALAIRRSAFDKVGGFDERLSWLNVDVDFCMQICRAGYRLHIDPHPRFVHEGGGSQITSMDRIVDFYVSTWYLLRKHGKLPAPPVIAFLACMRWFLECLILGILAVAQIQRSRRIDQARTRLVLIRKFWRGRLQ